MVPSLATRRDSMTPRRLDFYVHESCQRLGVGKLLLDVRASVPAAFP